MSRHEPRDAVTRREFLETSSAVVAAGAGAGLIGPSRARAQDVTESPAPKKDVPEIPKATLGRTGLKIPILGLGTALLGHQNQNNPHIPKLVHVFGDAIDKGITYVDTARIYGGAETALGEVLKTRRDKVILATKIWANTYEEAKKSFEESLAQLKVDAVDILHLHSAGDKDIDKVLGDGGSWEFLEEQKKKGTTRFLGITGHSRPANFVRLLETGKVDVMMVAMNFVDRYVYGFEEKVLPTARKHKTGILAMKVYGGVRGGFRNYGSRTPHPSQMDGDHHIDSIRYAKSLEGVTGMVIGAHNAAQVEENIRRVVEAKPFSKEEFEALCKKGEPEAPSWGERFGPAV